jgi:hypothetical protein
MENETLSFGMYMFYLARIATFLILTGCVGWLIAGKWITRKIYEAELETGQR